jgi:hypothetical protein
VKGRKRIRTAATFNVSPSTFNARNAVYRDVYREEYIPYRVFVGIVREIA